MQYKGVTTFLTFTTFLIFSQRRESVSFLCLLDGHCYCFSICIWGWCLNRVAAATCRDENGKGAINSAIKEACKATTIPIIYLWVTSVTFIEKVMLQTFSDTYFSTAHMYMPICSVKIASSIAVIFAVNSMVCRQTKLASGLFVCRLQLHDDKYMFPCCLYVRKCEIASKRSINK